MIMTHALGGCAKTQYNERNKTTFIDLLRVVKRIYKIQITLKEFSMTHYINVMRSVHCRVLPCLLSDKFHRFTNNYECYNFSTSYV